MAAKQFYEFGSFRLDPTERQLLRDNKRVALTPKCFDLLVALVENSGHLLEKEELLQRVWPNQFVEEGNLSFNISTLRKALGVGRDGQRYIETIPKKGFRFVAPVVKGPRDEESSIPTAIGTQPKPLSTRALAAESVVRQIKRRKGVVVALGVVLILTFGLLGLYRISSRRPSKPRATLRIVPFTSFSGQKSAPAFSPDGKQIAFVWDGPNGDNSDIYVKLIGEGNLLRLTTDPAHDGNPSWSPDGRFIAFIRVVKDEKVLMTIPALGGPERKVISFKGNPYEMWSPDGKDFVINSTDSLDELSTMFLVSAETGEKRKLTSPPSQFNGDRAGRFSPDAKSIAFIRSVNYLVEDIYVIPVTGGEPRRITNDSVRLIGLDWTADGREIVFASTRGGSSPRLWRVSVSGGAPEPLSGVGENAYFPRISRQGDQLAYIQEKSDWNIWRAPGLKSLEKNRTPIKFIASSRLDAKPEYSPDGKRIAFVSDRSGSYEIWVCDSEGSNSVQLTNFGSGNNGSPHWSPDGGQIAFDARVTGSSDIWTISVDGGSPRQLTTEPSADIVPVWSKDGRWILFGSDRTGGWQIWKIPAAGGQAVQVTKDGGYGIVGATDGFIYYTRSSGARIPAKKSTEPGVWRVPVDGGEEIRVFDQVDSLGNAFVKEDGIYFLNQPVTEMFLPSKTDRAIEFYSLINKQTAKVLSVDKTKPLGYGLCASPDGKWIIWSQMDQIDNDIVLVQNFQ